LLVPPAVVTVTETSPAPDGETTVTEVGVFAVMVAGLVPNFAAVAPARLTPVMVTMVPPPVDPWFGEIGMDVAPSQLADARLGSMRTGCRRRPLCRRATGKLISYFQ
jgi:hypothetical protein